MIDKIREALCGRDILFVCKTGSQLFCENCHDLDLIVVVKDMTEDCKYLHLKEDKICLFCFSESGFEKFAKGKLDVLHNPFAISLLFATGDNVLYGSNPIVGYDWWQYKKESFRDVVRFGQMSFLSSHVTPRKRPEYCMKQMVWGLALCFVLQNGSANFTEQQKQLLQLCHDRELPLAYRDKLVSDLKQLAPTVA